MKTIRHFIIALACLATSGMLSAQAPSIELFSDGIKHWFDQKELRRLKFDRYDATEYKGIADNLVAWQNSDGGWPKNIDILGKMDVKEMKQKLYDMKKRRVESTLDNRNTYPQIEYLSKVYRLTGDKKYMESARKGLQYVLDLQNESGGWRGWDVDAITFNDEVMTGAMEMLYRITTGDEDYAWVDPATKARCKTALDRAIDVTLRCQIVVDGKKTIWCQQHDHKTLAPVKARSYELPSFCPDESSDIMTFFMMMENPSDEIIDAVRCAAQWIEDHKITGIEVVKDKNSTLVNERTGKKGDVIVIENPKSDKVYWTRYYDLKTQKPFFCNRDGNVVYTLAEVEHERRTGYSWYTQSPRRVLNAYKKWDRALRKENR